MQGEKLIREVIQKQFDSCAFVIKDGSQVWLVKLAYYPYADMGAEYFIVDAYYAASNLLFQKINNAINDLLQCGIVASRRKAHDYKELIVRSGLAYGCRRNSLAYDQSGSRFVIGAINIPIEEQTSNYELKGKSALELCGDCDICINACPTNAISKSGMDATKCLRQYMHLGKYPCKEIAHSAGRRLLGCDICQRVCPHNHDVEKNVPDRLREILWINDFEKRLIEHRTELSEYIGDNYTKVEWLTALSKQLT